MKAYRLLASGLRTGTPDAVSFWVKSSHEVSPSSRPYLLMGELPRFIRNTEEWRSAAFLFFFLHFYTTGIHSVLCTVLGLAEHGWVLFPRNSAVLQEMSKLKDLEQ